MSHTFDLEGSTQTAILRNRRSQSSRTEHCFRNAINDIRPTEPMEHDQNQPPDLDSLPLNDATAHAVWDALHYAVQHCRNRARKVAGSDAREIACGNIHQSGIRVFCEAVRGQINSQNTEAEELDQIVLDAVKEAAGSVADEIGTIVMNAKLPADIRAEAIDRTRHYFGQFRGDE